MIDTLTSLLVPGGRARVSPYVQDAQFQILFGETPDSKDRHDSMRGILKNREKEVQKLADSYAQFATAGRRFVPNTYDTEDFLRLYLAYYFTTNLSKVQLCLLDLVGAGRLTGTLRLVDIGVGSGTTAVATLDFLLAWATACLLAGRPFPVKTLRIECYDLSPVCLEVARRVVNAFCESVSRRKESVYGQKSMAEVMDLVSSWGNSAEWQRVDISQAPIKHPGDSQVLLFASNVLNELSEAGKAALAASIANMPEGSVATVIEPGDKRACASLNAWKASLLREQSGVRSLFTLWGSRP